MAYSDPQSVVLNGDTFSLPRTGSSGNSGQFSSPDQRYKLIVRHQNGNRRQNVARLEFSGIVPNLLVPSQNQVVSAAVTFTVNAPLNGLASSELRAMAAALVDWLTEVNLGKLVGGEM